MKITTRGSPMQLGTTKTYYNHLTHQGMWAKESNLHKSCKVGARLSEVELTLAHNSITQHKLGWTGGGTAMTHYGS